MTVETWWLFFGAVFLLCGTPGPNMLHVMTRSVEFGVRRSIAAMAGCMVALVLVLSASAGGLTALLMALPGVFELLRYAGAAYLLYLGVQAWRADVAPIDVGEDKLPSNTSAAKLFRGGFVIGISNPKLLLFAAAFLPQFVSANAPKAPQFAILVLTFAAAELFWYAVYGVAGGSLSRHLRKPALKHAFNKVTGTIFVGFGAMLLRVRPV
ncbi:MAG: LysE family translocator [Porphyrobacter sp.]|nr:LysE family translocator [Porphyrobacter sp.]